MQSFEWRPVSLSDWEMLTGVRQQFHQAIQNVSAVGRRFSPPSRQDVHATLTWVPGLSRLAGSWVEGNITFRSSISFDSFSIFLVDQKVATLSEFTLEGKTYRQLMLWLEEQIGKFGLDASNLVMKLPYELPNMVRNNASPFQISDMLYAMELGRYFHNTYITLRNLKKEVRGAEIRVWPHHFDMAMDHIIKNSGDPETTTKISLGMSPGDESSNIPYFYVNTWPHVDVNRCGDLTNGSWVSQDWTGATLMAEDLLSEKSGEILERFYREASEQLIKQLTD